MVTKVRWERYELDDGDLGRFVEICRAGTRVYEREGVVGEEGTVTASPYRSVAQAQASLDQRTRALRDDGYDLADTFRAPTDDAVRASEAKAARLLALPEAFCTYADAWTAKGYRLDWSFRKTAARRKLPVGEVLGACLDLAHQCFETELREVIEIDEEHGQLGALPRGRSADYYCCPMCVAGMAEAQVLQPNTYVGDLSGCGGNPLAGPFGSAVRMAQGYALWQKRRGTSG